MCRWHGTLPLSTNSARWPLPPARGANQGAGNRRGGAEEGTRRQRWVETRLAEVVTLDCLGEELAGVYCGVRKEAGNLLNGLQIPAATVYYLRGVRQS